MTEDPFMLARPNGPSIACRKRDGASPTILFLPGYRSDMDGAKALAIDAFAAERGVAMLRFDYAGTGLSEGRFEDGTLSGWLDDALLAVERLADGPLVLAGSSMGGWIALLLALRLPRRVAGIAGIAAAPDFTEWGYTDADKSTLRSQGRLLRDNPYGDDPQLTTAAFWQSGQRHLLLGDDIAIHCPVRLVHGDRDDDVPLSVALALKDRLRSADVQLTIVKGGGHRLSGPGEIAAVVGAVASLLDASAEPE